MRTSVLRSSLPENSMLPMEGRSTTDTTSVSPSRSSRTSRKKPVRNKARTAPAVRVSSTVSPTWIGR